MTVHSSRSVPSPHDWIGTLSALLLALCAFLAAVPCGVAEAQSPEQGFALMEQARSLQNNPEQPGNPANALRLYRQAARILQSAGDEPNLARATYHIAQLHTLYTGRFRTAERLYTRALELFQAQHDTPMQARCRLGLGAVAERLAADERAMDHYQAALALARSSGEEALECQILPAIANLHRAGAAYDKALPLLERAMELSRRLDRPRSLAYALELQAWIRDVQDKRDDALASYAKALTLWQARQADDREADVHLNMGRLSMELGRYDQAQEHMFQAVFIFGEMEHQERVVDGLTWLGEIARRQGRSDVALMYCENARTGLRRLRPGRERKRIRARLLTNQAEVYRRRADLDKAQRLFRQADRIWERLDDRRARATGQLLQGRLAVDMGRFHEALEQYYTPAVQTFRELKDAVNTRKTLSHMAHAYVLLGRYGHAFTVQEQAVETARKARDDDGVAEAMARLSTIYDMWGDAESTLRCIREAVQAVDKTRDHRLACRLNRQLAGVLAQQGRPREARDVLEKAVTRAEEAALPRETDIEALVILSLRTGDLDAAKAFAAQSQASFTHGLLAMAQDNHPLAVEKFLRALQTAHDQDNDRGRFSAALGLGQALEAMAQWSDAADYYQYAVHNLDQLMVPAQPAPSWAPASIDPWPLDRSLALEGLARTLMRMDRFHEAFAASQWGRAETFAQALQRSPNPGRYGLPSAFLAEADELTHRIPTCRRKLARAQAQDQDITAEALKSRLSELERQWSRYLTRLRARHPRFAAARYPEPLELADAGLKDGGRLLAYDVTDTHLLVYLVDGKAVVRARAVKRSRKSCRDLIERFLGSVTGQQSQEEGHAARGYDLAGARKLTTVLLEDILPLLPPGEPLTIIPDEYVALLPFGMLPLGNHGGVDRSGASPRMVDVRFFSDRNPMSYQQSLHTMSADHARRSKRLTGSDVLVIADAPGRSSVPAGPRHNVPEARPGWTVAPAVATAVHARERAALGATLAQGIQALFPEHSTVLTGPAATLPRMREALAHRHGRFRAMAFAVPAYLGSDLPGIREPAIFVSPPDGSRYHGIALTGIMDMRLHTGVVTIPICMTPEAGPMGTEGAMNLARAFQYAGAESVLLNLWPVDEQSTVMLLEAFFTAYKQGETSLAALSQAQQRIRDQGYTHPYHWAGFVLVGE